MNAHRRSALLLHGLNEEDQRWVLARLEAPQRELLDGMLGELVRLNFPRDEALHLQPAAAPQPGDRLRQAQAGQMAAVLAGEPLWMLAAVLAAGDWPWREAYCAGLDGMRRARLLQLPRPALAPKAAALLVAQLEQRLAALPGTPALPPAPAGRGAAWTSRVRTWLR
jgi:hypothetical protein